MKCLLLTIFCFLTFYSLQAQNAKYMPYIGTSTTSYLTYQYRLLVFKG